ncbi:MULTISPECIES: hypothetical protein [Myxococcus]|uniref:hypothetical protein n=1 Tax=Myxococcus TaxID=32 RepID=UPI0011279DAF|nr:MULTISPECIES: hypothetical protein [Myxococcus]QDF05008.1 hypothetical protein BHS04_17620 [Myxococcus xanthus]WAM28511.1 hypothetical protein OZ403_10520 [Myxococcus sp. NMCA1]
MPVRVRFDPSRILALRRNAQEVLRKLDVPLHDAARRTLELSAPLVPRRPPAEHADAPTSDGPPLPPLADTGFVSDAAYNMTKRLSVSRSAGYEHPQAGPIHEGVHWGKDIVNPPPHFLKKAFRRSRSVARKGVQQVLADYLAQLNSRSR